MTTFAGSPGNAGSGSGPALGGAKFDSPQGVVVALDGTVYVADTGNSTIRRIAGDGIVSTIAGVAGLTGTANGQGSEARFFYPGGLAIDGHGDLLVADTFNHAIRKVTPTGVVTTFAGKPGSAGSAEGTPNLARFNDPSALAVDAAGNVYVADSGNNTIRLISANGVVSTLAGKAGQIGSVDGIRSAARFNFPSGITLAGDQLWVADTQNHTIRKVTFQGVVSTMAGQAGVPGLKDGSGTGALFHNPRGIAFDTQGFLFASDEKNQTIRWITTNGIATKAAGVAGIKGSNDGPSLSATFSGPTGIAVDLASSIFVADTANHAIRKVSPTHPRPTRIIQLGGELNFGEINVGKHPTHTLAIANLGNTDLKVAQIVAPAGFAIPWIGVVLPHTTNEVPVTFNPVSVGDYGGQIVVQSDATGGVGTIGITGRGIFVPMPEISLSTSLLFGTVEVGQISHTNLIISNVGTGPLEVTRILYPPGFAGTWRGVIPPGASQSVDVVFEPVRETVYEGVVQIISNTSVGDGTFAIRGVGVLELRREASLAGNFMFGNRSVGLSDYRLITIANDGYGDLHVTKMVCPEGFVCPWSGIIPAGSERTFPIWFIPKETRDYAGKVTLESDASAVNGEVLVSGKGTPGWTEPAWRVEPLTMRNYSVPGTTFPFGKFNTDNKHSICISPKDEIVIIDFEGVAIWRATRLGAVSLLAGSPGNPGKSDGKGSSARFSWPMSPTFSSTGDLFLIDADRICRITPDGVVTTLSTSGLSVLSRGPASIGWSSTGYLYISDYRPQMFQMDGLGVVRLVESLWGGASAIASTSDGHIIVPMSGAGAVQISDGKPQVGRPKLLTVVGGYSGRGFQDGNMVTAMFSSPGSVAIDRYDNIFISDQRNHAIRMIDPNTYQVKTILGNGPPWKAPTGYFGTNAWVDSPISVAVDSDQNLVILEQSRDFMLRGIRKDSPSRNLYQFMSWSLGTAPVGRSTFQELTLLNAGDAEIHVRGLMVPPGFRASWSGVIGPGQSVQIPVEFHPDAPGYFDGSILVDSDANLGQDTYPVRGTAVESSERRLSILADVDFGECAIGEEVHRTVTNYISGTVTTHIWGVSLPMGFYGATKGGQTPKTPTSTSAFVMDIVFRPSKPGEYSGLMTVNSDATEGVNYINVSGRGRLKEDPKLKVSTIGAADPLRVTWPTAPSGYLLESSETLGLGAIWAPRTNGILTVSNQFSILIERNQSQEFFRLRKP